MKTNSLDRQETAHNEATRDPIFLLQAADIVIVERDQVEYCDACERLCLSLCEHDCSGDDYEPISNQELIYRGIAEVYWRTEYVFLSREEGERYGKAKHYHYPDGWRVYCIPAMGDLANLLGRGL